MLAAGLYFKPRRLSMTFQDLLKNVGGEAAYLRSVAHIRELKLGGRRGDAQRRLTRDLLNLSIKNGCLAEYVAFAARFQIPVAPDEQDVPRHDYSLLPDTSRVTLNWVRGEEAGFHTIGAVSEATARQAEALLARAARAGFTAFVTVE
jgi:hypothetical protein